MGTTITIIDYGMGNLRSVQNALHYLGVGAVISNSAASIASADALVLPGVGSFRSAMLSLESTGLDQAIQDAVLTRGRKILGICLGMQLMGTSSTEDGVTQGLGLIPAPVERFSDRAGRKVPHIGFNTVTAAAQSQLMRGMQDKTDFYFVHSYRMSPLGLAGRVSTCDYGGLFVAAYEQANIFATQFHPEKSQTNGLLLLKNFLAL